MANKPLAPGVPEWHVELDDAQETQTALGLDALRTTRAIRTKVETPEQINEVFDPIATKRRPVCCGCSSRTQGPTPLEKLSRRT
jgi:hypothetical protein